MAVYSLNPDGTAFLVGVSAFVTDLVDAVHSAIDSGRDLELSIRPHARSEDDEALGAVARLVHDLADSRGRESLASFERYPFGVRIRFEGKS